jgi:hypothetical protein
MSNPPFGLWPPIVGGGGGGSITEIDSANSRLVVMNPTGPVVSLQSLTGNPYTDNWGTPNAADDEFDGGDDSMNARGWEVWNLTDNVAITWQGKVSISTLPPATQYRSTRVGTYMAIQVPANKSIWFGRSVSPAMGVNSTIYLKAANDWKQDMYDFGAYGPRNDLAVQPNTNIGVYGYNGAVGTTPVGKTFMGWYLATDSGNARWGLEFQFFAPDPPTAYLGSTNINSAASSLSSLLGTDLLAFSNSVNGWQNMWCIDSASGKTLGKYTTNVPTRPISLARMGFRLFNREDQNCTLVDYFRIRPTGWFGLTV